MKTLAQLAILDGLADRSDLANPVSFVTFEDHLDLEELIPVLTAIQCQGDLIVVPTRKSRKAGVAVPREGVPVLRGENGGNTHLLVADGPVSWAVCDPSTGDLGVLTVEPDATAWLLHPEHGANGIGAGSYIVRRQREQADEIRMVQD